MSAPRLIAAILAVAAIAFALWRLEGYRAGIEITHTAAGTTPVTLYTQDAGQQAPLVVIAHGFAGSRQLMEAYALTLARAGYHAASFDFEGHGRNPVPMSGDVDAVEGTTQLLIAETRRVLTFALEQVESVEPVGILGHSMATDIIIRTALIDDRIGPIVGISTFSQAVTETRPDRLLMVSGSWEPGLRAFALEKLREIDPAAEEGDTVTAAPRTDAAGEVARPESITRRAVVAPNVEHVGVLYSPTALQESVAWLDAAFGRSSPEDAVAATGWPILLLLGGIVLAAWPLAALLPRGDAADAAAVTLKRRDYALVLLVPAIIAPLIAIWLPRGTLPVLVADYLALHLLIYGGVQLALLYRFGARIRWDWLGAAALAAFGIGVFGMALDRYVASFVPTVGRLPIVAVLAVGSVAFMLADRMLADIAGGFWKNVLTKLVFFLSLGIALAIDFERLFFLLLIIPVMILFFLIFGLMGRWVGRRRGPAAAGIGLGLLLGWALGVTFPLFES